jgi:Lon protease-like protein
MLYGVPVPVRSPSVVGLILFAAASAQADAPSAKEAKVSSDLLQQLPVLPLRGSVLFPQGVLPLNIGREKTVRAIRRALDRGGYIGVVSLKTVDVDEPNTSDLYSVGTLARIVKFAGPDNSGSDYYLVVEGERRFKVANWLQADPFFSAKVELAAQKALSAEETAELSSTALKLKQVAKEMVVREREMPDDMVANAAVAIDSIREPAVLADLSIANSSLPIDKKMSVLSTDDVLERVRIAFSLLEKHVAGMAPSDRGRLAQPATEVQPSWRQDVATARERVFAAMMMLAHSVRYTGKEVLLEPAVRTDSGALENSGKLQLPRRADAAILVGTKAHPIENRVGRVGATRREFTWHAALPVSFLGFGWDACLVHVRGWNKATRAATTDWFWRWFDRMDEKQKDEKGLRGVVHSLDVASEDREAVLKVDLGTAPIEAFEDLLDTLQRAGASSVEFSGEAADPAADPGLK